MFVFYEWPFPHICTLQRMQHISLLILGSVFSDCSQCVPPYIVPLPPPPRWVCWVRSSVVVGLTVVTNRQTDHATCVATGRIFTLCIAMRPKNYSERQNWRHQFRGQHERNKARCKRVVVAVGNCTRAMCVRARRCQCSSTESARSPSQHLYIPGRFMLRQASVGDVCVMVEMRRIWLFENSGR